MQPPCHPQALCVVGNGKGATTLAINGNPALNGTRHFSLGTNATLGMRGFTLLGGSSPKAGGVEATNTSLLRWDCCGVGRLLPQPVAAAAGDDTSSGLLRQ